MKTKRFVVEMDEMLAELLDKTGQMKIIENFRKDYDSRSSTEWVVTAGDRCEYKGRSKDAALETYTKFLAYSKGTENHPAYNKPVTVTKDGEVYMEHKVPEKGRKK